MKKPTLTIGIPAYNEAKTIGTIISSVLRQNQSNYVLKKILVVLDGSTDSSLKVLKKIQKKNKDVKVIFRKSRLGKANALNMIYSKAKTDYLLTIDADLFFEGNDAISSMISTLRENKKLNLTGIRHKPLMPKTWMGKFAAFSYLILENTTRKINNGNNFYSVMGMEMMPKKFYKNLRLPKFTLSDQCYVYASATEKDRSAFALVHDQFVYFMPVQTFYDWRILSVRSVRGDKSDVMKHFGRENVLQRYSLSKVSYIKSLVKFFFISPLVTIGALAMEIFIRVFPYRKPVVINGMWEETRSSKVGV